MTETIVMFAYLYMMITVMDIISDTMLTTNGTEMKLLIFVEMNS